MELVKDIEKIKRMFSQGQTELVDAKTGYKRSMVAYCPEDGSIASVARTEKSGEALSKVTFRCNSCFTEFEAAQEDIYLQ